VVAVVSIVSVSQGSYPVRHTGNLRALKPYKCPDVITLLELLTLHHSMYWHHIILLAGCSQQQLDKLQRVLNCAAVIYGGRRGDHVTLLLRDHLHWLRIRERITFKLCLLVYKATHGLTPSHIADICIPVATMSTQIKSNLIVSVACIARLHSSDD